MWHKSLPEGPAIRGGELFWFWLGMSSWGQSSELHMLDIFMKLLTWPWPALTCNPADICGVSFYTILRAYKFWTKANHVLVWR